MYQQENVMEVKRRLIERGILKSCRFADMNAELERVMRKFSEVFPRIGDALFSYWMGVYEDPDASPTIRKEYHNRAHILTALDRLFSREVMQDAADLHGREKQAVVLTLLLHDVHHSCGQFDDTMNINRAMQTICIPPGSYWCDYPALTLAGVSIGEFMADINAGSQTDVSFFMKLCRELLQQTEYPYKGVPTNAGGILRDIDRLALLSRDYFEEVYEGLYSEICVNNPTQFVHFCRNQIVFAKNFEWFSDDLRQVFQNRPAMLEAELLTYQIYDVAREVASEQFDGY